MPDVLIYHNPKCSKSRQTLQLLEDRGYTPTIIRYLESTPTEAELREVLGKLGMTANELIRKKEALFKELSLSGKGEAELISAMAQHPRLIERPIVIHGDSARLGRPPENVIEIL
jgi:arsenate reductase (glutaredoxin)